MVINNSNIQPNLNYNSSDTSLKKENLIDQLKNLTELFKNSQETIKESENLQKKIRSSKLDPLKREKLLKNQKKIINQIEKIVKKLSSESLTSEEIPLI